MSESPFPLRSLSDVQLGEMRAMGREAALNGGRGKHDDPAYYSRNLAILLGQAIDELERERRETDTYVEMAERVLAALRGRLNMLRVCLERLTSHLPVTGYVDVMCSRSPKELRREIEARAEFAKDYLDRLDMLEAADGAS